jgi:hypothetical protein
MSFINLFLEKLPLIKIKIKRSWEEETRMIGSHVV